MKTFDVKLDHFNASKDNTAMFSMRYILNETFNTDKKGPILFYAGNEGSIEVFYANSGFMLDVLAPALNATVMFGEHRYYGESIPFGNKTIAYNATYLKYLNVEQVFQDYIDLIKSVKTNGSYDNFNGTSLTTPVYSFGGSYGGMLAAWLRMKFPTHFQGAIASSAPILWFKGKVDPSVFTKIASDVILDISG